MAWDQVVEWKGEVVVLQLEYALQVMAAVTLGVLVAQLALQQE
jgi:hypothetical protein